MNKTREECLKLIKEDIKCKHSKAWTLLCLAVLFSIISALFIGYYTFNGYMYSGCGAVVTYALMFVLSTFSLGYISAFIFYYYHDYLPMASEVLEEYQVVYAIEKIVYDSAVTLEKMVFGTNVPSQKYVELLTNDIVENPNNTKVKIKQEIWNWARLNKTIIEDGNKGYILLKRDVAPMLFVFLTLSLDIYTQLSQKNIALYGSDLREVEVDDLQLVVGNYKKSLEDLRGLINTTERYIYNIETNGK